jgi:hypothetical protein
MPAGKPLHLRLFLEGEEVPVISAQVQINTSAPATASIQIIPLDSAMDFLPRTMVHLFFYDSRVDTSQGPRQEGVSNLVGEYRLLFSGEVMGFAYSQTPASRGIVLQCMDFSNYWDSAHVMAISYGPGGNAFTNDGSVNGALSGMFTDIPGDSAAEHLVRWLKSTPVTEGLKGVSGLAGGVIHIMEAMGGVPGHFKGVNDFYTIAELRCRLLNQISAEENDNTASRVLSINVFEEWLKNGIEQAGGDISFRDVMRLLFQYIYYEFVPNPAPKFDDAKTNKVPTTATISLLADPELNGIRALLFKVQAKLVAAKGILTTVPAATLLSKAESILYDLNIVKKRYAAFKKKSAEVTQSNASVLQAISAMTRFTTQSSSSEAEILQAALGSFPPAWDAVNKSIEVLDEAKASVASLSKSFASQRLRTQIIRPDCWFSSPPVCNVIFPEMYAQISYDRNYLQETTRLLVHTFDTLVGKDHLLAGHILTPLIGLDAEKLTKKKGAGGFRVLMDHEIHVGIIPKSEWIPNTAGIGHALDAAQLKKVKNGLLSWTVKASLFKFFKYRFAARQVGVAGRFNPFLVCGFPGVVITRPYSIPGGAAELRNAHDGNPVPDSEINTVIHQKADQLHAPSHFVGMIAGVQHSIDQSGGTTSVTLTHARKHRGSDDEFIGVLIKTNEGKTKRIVKVLLDVQKAQDLAFNQNNTKPLALLLGVTPQQVETQAAATPSQKNSKLVAETKSQPVKTESRDPRNPGSGTTMLGSTQATEADARESQSETKKDPPRTKRGSIAAVNRTNILIPHGSTSIKINEKKGLYGGRIVGIEIIDEVGAGTVDVSFDSSYTVTKYKDVTGVQASFAGTVDVGASGVDQTKVAATLAKTTKKVASKTSGKAFKNVAVYEEIDVAVSGSLPIEEVLRPSWFSTAYANQNIGSKIYNPFFGCGAVVDGLSVSGTTPPSSDGSSDSEPVDASVSKEDLNKKLQAEEKSKVDNSLEKALNLLGYEYGLVKQQEMDVDAFIRDYTDRPIATLQDIFGDSDLKFKVKDAAVGGDAKPIDVTRNGTTVTPRVGFHSGATHPDLVAKGKLVGLTTDLQLSFPRVNGVGAKEPLVQDYDVRPAKKLRVVKYIADLGRGPGFQG